LSSVLSGCLRPPWLSLIVTVGQELDGLGLVKTVDLDPKKNYIFGFHPHGEKLTCLSGCLVAGGFGNFCTEATGFFRLFPGLTSHLLMLPFWFRVPLFRDYIMCGGTHLSACPPVCPLSDHCL
uniref:Monoacylglycerol O-acyltransferase 3a n=1 Tax=Seriola dumerili TaxID=41447 RepID=A0A3B4TZD7_SERDU